MKENYVTLRAYPLFRCDQRRPKDSHPTYRQYPVHDSQTTWANRQSQWKFDQTAYRVFNWLAEFRLFWSTMRLSLTF